MDGLLLVNKPKGISSYEVVKKIGSLIKGEKVGHAGTLDPAAEGLLIVCVGKATKLAFFLQDFDKAYRVKLLFGITTTTFDEEGQIVEKKDASLLTENEVRSALDQFRGRISQIPPMHSAIHWQGQRLYKLAREGKEVKISPRSVFIHKLELVKFVPGVHPEAELEIGCSKGTYVRSLCQDIGRASGYGAYQAALWRTRIGSFALTEAKDLYEITQAVDSDELTKLLVSPVKALPDFYKIVVKKEAEKLIKWGRPLYISHIASIPDNLEKGDMVKLCSEENKLLAVGVALQSSTHFTRDRAGFKYLRVFA